MTLVSAQDLLFHERQKMARGEYPSVLRLDIFPTETKKQCWTCVDNVSYSLNISFETIHRTMTERLGRDIVKEKQFRPDVRAARMVPQVKNLENAKIIHPDVRNYKEELLEFFVCGFEGGNTTSDIEYSFSVLELICISCNKSSNKETKENTINSINSYLMKSGIGFNFLNGKLFPYLDENLLYTSINPLLSFLNQDQFKESFDYLCVAFEKFKNEDYETSIDNVAKSYESFLKKILSEKNIEYPSTATLKPLLNECKKNELFYQISDDKVNAIANLLETISPLRNTYGGHSKESHEKPDENIVLLILHHVTANMLYIARKNLIIHK